MVITIVVMTIIATVVMTIIATTITNKIDIIVIITIIKGN